MTSNLGSIGNPIYNMLENINEKEKNPDLNTMHQDMSDDVIYVDCLDQATASGSPSGDADIVSQQPSGSKGRARGGKRKKRRNWRSQRMLAASRKTACTKKGKRVQTKYHWNTFRPTLNVYCGRTTGVLFKEEMKKGVREKCITVQKTGDPNAKWYTLSEFEVLGGYGRSKNWKISIRCCCCKQMLKTLIKAGKLPKLPHFRKGKGKAPVHQASRVQPSDVDGLGQATASTAPGSPSGDADILLQQPSGSKASNQRTDIPSSLHRTRLQVTMHDLKQALDMSDVKRQMTDIYNQSLTLKTSVEKMMKT
ncbi:nuclear body protein SP140-like [Anolis sagrei]|uniref:nuclear body protein SP140-like n=1 Tax=Anolis sagrei TaxID=38937 RepID=UPI0035219F74